MRKFEEFINRKAMQFPNSDWAETQHELLEIMEDKYEDLIKSGMKSDTAIDRVISDFQDFGEIYDELENKDIRTKYDELMDTYTQKTFFTVLGMFLIPGLILVILGSIANLMNSRIILFWGLIPVCTSIAYFVYLLVKRESIKSKYEKILESKSESRLRNTQTVLICFTIASMIVIDYIVADSILIILPIPIATAVFYLIKNKVERTL